MYGRSIKMPRVIAGKYGGIPLQAPKGEHTRPTADKVKEALFSILQTRIPDSRFLDLFSGSGQMGIEAVSRGAEKAVLVDENRESASAIEANILKTGSRAETAFYRRDVFRTLEALGESHEIFDIIFMDPPYASAVTYCSKAAEYICRYGLLKPGGLFIVEHAAVDVFSENVMNLTLYRRCKYGSTMLTFYTTDAL